MNLRTNIPILVDFDGVIKIGKTISPFAKDFLDFIHKQKLKAIIISNSTLSTSTDIRNFLTQNGISIDLPILTAIEAAIKFVKKRYRTVKVFCAPEMKKHFAELKESTEPEAVLIGDLGDEWNYSKMNEIFRYVYNGAQMIAMQKNKYWKPGGKELTLDAGAFISGIEYAANREAILVGKPSPLYFQAAIEELGFKEKFPFIMIGDDLETDIYAAQNIGGIGILVFTGKTSPPLSKNLKFKPDYEAYNLEEVTYLLKNQSDLKLKFK